MRADTHCLIRDGRVPSLFVALALTASLCVGGAAMGAPTETGEGLGGTSGHIESEVVLSTGAAPATAGELRADGLVFRVLPDGASVALVGWSGESLPADVVVPARVSSGADLFAVTALGVPGADGRSDALFKDSGVESVSLPATVANVADGALSDCDTLARVLVSQENEAHTSFDGMLFSKDLSSLLLVPEGKEGSASIPDPTATVPASAFSRCARLQAVEVGEGNAALSSRNGMLFTKDMKTLLACPPGAGSAVVVPLGTEAIGPKAFAGCGVASIAALGDVREIAADAFEEAAKSAVIALPSEGYESRKAVWEAAGFSRFAEPANPGDTATPDGGEGQGPDGSGAEADPAPDGSGPDSGAGQQVAGLAFTLLNDYTLSVSWAGEGEAPASLEVPATAELNGASYRVSAVAPSGFEGLASLETVKLPAGVASIGDAAFAGCSKLASVELPDGLRSIGDRAFEATALSEVWLPASVESVGSRALADCKSLARVVALGTPEVAGDALAGCSGVSVYCPDGSEDSWNVGLPAAGNHVLPYAATLAAEPLAITAGESADLLEGGELLAPEPVKASYSYSAKPLSVNPDGSVAGKSEGATDVAVSLALDGVELARASRSVEVAPGEAEAAPAMVNETAILMPAAYLAGARAAAAPISVTAPVAVTFGDGNGYDVAIPASSVASTGVFRNNSDGPVRLASISCEDSGASSVLEVGQSDPALEAQELFSIAPASDPSKGFSFGLGASDVSPADKGAFLIEAGSSLECSYGLDLTHASVKASVADHGMMVKPLATLTCLFELAPGQGKESDEFYLKDTESGLVYSLAEVKAHAEDISAKGEGSQYFGQYTGYLANDASYDCKTKWGGVSYDVRVIGMNHDDKAGVSGKAGLTFQFKECLDPHDTDGWGYIKGYRMNAGNTMDNYNAGGWGASELRARMNPGEDSVVYGTDDNAIWNIVPSDLQEAIVAVDKKYAASSSASSVSTSSDKLFLASYSELVATSYWTAYPWTSQEGAQYEYWEDKVANNAASNPFLSKHNQSSMSSEAIIWWERSVGPYDGTASFSFVAPNGNPASYNAASNSNGVCPCFCL